MSFQAERISGNQYRIDFEVPKEDFDAAMQQSYLKNRGRINVPGFRKGKAPVYTLIQDVIVPPYQYMLELHELYNVFKLGLIIVVGYELIKSLLIIINSDSIPSKTILNIAIIAVANKIITLDLSHTGFESVLTLAALALALGVGNYFLKEDILKKDKEA